MASPPRLPVELHVAAEREAREAFLWYYERDVRAGGRFDAAFHRAIADLDDTPLLSPEIAPGIRRLMLAGFPYALIYTVEERRIFVLAVAHGSRRPGYWRRRAR